MTDADTFIEALAKTLGFTTIEQGESPWGGKLAPHIDAGDGLVLVVGGIEKGRVSIRCRTATGPLTHSEIPKYPDSITVDPTRPLDKLANDIQRRLIGYGRPWVLAVRQALGTRALEVASMDAILADWQAAAFPGLRVTRVEPLAINLSFFNGDKGSIDVTVYQSGSVNIHRLHLYDRTKLRDIVGVLTK